MTPSIIWDPDKARGNILKHGVTLVEAATVMEDDYALTIDEWVQDEQRHITLGMSDKGNLLIVVYTYRVDDLRLISARKAAPSERAFYMESQK